MIQGLFSVPIKVGTIVPSEYEEAETDQLLSGLFLDGKLGDFTGETGLSTAPKVMNLHEKEELKWLTSKLTYGGSRLLGKCIKLQKSSVH